MVGAVRRIEHDGGVREATPCIEDIVSPWYDLDQWGNLSCLAGTRCLRNDIRKLRTIGLVQALIPRTVSDGFS
jgi:hypothetical protein